MTRAVWRPPPQSDVLRELAVDVVVRDFPETLAVLRREGLDPREHGGRRLGDLATPEVLEALAAALSRRSPP